MAASKRKVIFTGKSWGTAPGTERMVDADRAEELVRGGQAKYAPHSKKSDDS